MGHASVKRNKAETTAGGCLPAAGRRWASLACSRGAALLWASGWVRGVECDLPSTSLPGRPGGDDAAHGLVGAAWQLALQVLPVALGLRDGRGRGRQVGERQGAAGGRARARARARPGQAGPGPGPRESPHTHRRHRRLVDLTAELECVVGERADARVVQLAAAGVKGAGREEEWRAVGSGADGWSERQRDGQRTGGPSPASTAAPHRSTPPHPARSAHLISWAPIQPES